MKKKETIFEYEKRKLITDLEDYPELIEKLNDEEEDQEESMESSSIKWLKSINLYQNLDLSYFQNIKNLRHNVIKCSNYLNEEKILKQIIIDEDENYKNEIKILNDLNNKLKNGRVCMPQS